MPSFIEEAFVLLIVISIGSLGRGWQPPVAASFKYMLTISGCWRILFSFPQGLPMWQACESDWPVWRLSIHKRTERITQNHRCPQSTAVQHGFYHALVREVTKFYPNLRSGNIDQMQCTTGPRWKVLQWSEWGTPSQPLHINPLPFNFLPAPIIKFLVFRNQMGFKRRGIPFWEPLWSAEEAAPLSYWAIPTRIPSLNQ